MLLLLFVGPVLVVGLPLVWRAGRGSAASEGQVDQRRWWSRLTRARDALVTELGATPAAIAIGLAGLAVVVAVCWPAGGIAARLEVPLDRPFFDWSQQVLDTQSAMASISRLLTQMGDAYPVVAVVTICSVVLAILWRRRGWWVPPALLFAALAAELILQTLLKQIVNRGHPPTALGTYPSGGTARLIDVGGVLVFLVLLTWPRLAPRVRAALWLAVALVAATEAFTRTYLLQHWLSDVFGGALFGALLLAAMLAAASALVSRPEPGDPVSAVS